MLESELTGKVMEVFGEASPRDREVKILSHDPAKGELCLRVQQMYEYVDVTFENLKKVSELCQTESINIGSRDSYGGCETCDYGSCYMVDLHLKNFWIPLEEGPKIEKKRSR